MVSGIQKAPHYAGQLQVVVDRLLSASIKKSYMREIGKLIEYARLVMISVTNQNISRKYTFLSQGCLLTPLYLVNKNVISAPAHNTL